MEILYPNLPNPVSSYVPKGAKASQALWDGNQMRGYALDAVILNIGNIHALPFQMRVKGWVSLCMGDTRLYDAQERNWRFGEESMELMQAKGATLEEVIALAHYVFGRPVGDPFQEVGGVMTTLAALCCAADIDMVHAAETEYARVNTPEVMEKIRRKNASKPKFGPLPGVANG